MHVNSPEDYKRISFRTEGEILKDDRFDTLLLKGCNYRKDSHRGLNKKDETEPLLEKFVFAEKKLSMNCMELSLTMSKVFLHV